LACPDPWSGHYVSTPLRTYSKEYARASQAYLWGLPAVGLIELKHAQNEIFKARNGQWVGMISFDEKLGLFTPIYTTPYVVSIADLAKS
jgi:hypothetical protein